MTMEEKKEAPQGTKNKIDLAGIAKPLDDSLVAAGIDKIAKLRNKLKNESDESARKAIGKELRGSVKETKKRISAVAEALYEASRRNYLLKKKDLKAEGKKAGGPKVTDRLAELKRAQSLAETQMELDKANALRLAKGKEPEQTGSIGWKMRLAGWKAARPFVNGWKAFEKRFPRLAEFLVFLLLSNGVTILQIALQDIFLAILNSTDLVNVSFQLWAIPGASSVHLLDGQAFYTQYYIFDYFKGNMASLVEWELIDGTSKMLPGGGGLAYFLSVQITGAIAQVINFFAQRNITFKSHGNPWWAAMWYVIAYFGIMIASSALQGLYKAPIYEFFLSNNLGDFLPNLITMIIYAAISFWVFYPIFKFIFPSDEALAKKAAKKAARNSKNK